MQILKKANAQNDASGGFFFKTSWRLSAHQIGSVICQKVVPIINISLLSTNNNCVIMTAHDRLFNVWLMVKVSHLSIWVYLTEWKPNDIEWHVMTWDKYKAPFRFPCDSVASHNKESNHKLTTDIGHYIGHIYSY